MDWLCSSPEGPGAPAEGASALRGLHSAGKGGYIDGEWLRRGTEGAGWLRAKEIHPQSRGARPPSLPAVGEAGAASPGPVPEGGAWPQGRAAAPGVRIPGTPCERGEAFSPWSFTGGGE